ncbi:helix-turn-helix domain-containing protein [Microlunatus soli]|uniref:helix-turn-helix domain-containing protein n=1 Tax=Microlunatus soli TaxID=630515 RepID=UPI0018D4B954
MTKRRRLPTYLRRVRLDHARRNLQAADPTQGETVKAIAARWGFPRPDRFAARYQEAFGVPPSHTLRS